MISRLNPTSLWLTLRILVSGAAFVGSLRPGPVGEGLARIFVEPWRVWDAGHFARALVGGFRHADGTATFHPLSVWLALPAYFLTGYALLALLITASLCALLAYRAFEALAREDLSDTEARRALLLFACFPSAYVLFAPYTEAAFVLFAALSLLHSARRRFLLAGLFAALATLTRQQGLFLIIPLAWEAWEAKSFGVRTLAGLAQIPAAYFLWIAYRAATSGEPAPDLSNFQGIIYSTLIAPAAKEIVPDQAFLSPPQGLYLSALKIYRDGLSFTLAVDLLLGGVFIVLFALAWRHMRVSHRLYCLTIFAVSFCCVTGPVSTYMGLPRHLLLAFPIFVGLAPRVRKQNVVVASAACLLLLAFLHTAAFWVP